MPGRPRHVWTRRCSALPKIAPFPLTNVVTHTVSHADTISIADELSNYRSDVADTSAQLANPSAHISANSSDSSTHKSTDWSTNTTTNHAHGSPNNCGADAHPNAGTDTCPVCCDPGS